MMTPPGTYERVYQAIKQRLGEGFYKPGARIDVTILAEELNASTTPVRDALHRLTGERLIEATKYDGFRTPAMTETTLRHLYGWHFDLLMLAAMRHRALDFAGQTPLGEASSNAPARERQNAVFLAMARDGGNPEHVWALRSVTERLEPVQRLEGAFLDGTELETNGIIDALEAGDRKALRRNLVNYHRRREQLVPELLAGLLDANGGA